MAAFSFEAFDAQGKKIKGRVESSDAQAAIQDLKSKGLRVIKIGEYKGSIWTRELELGSRKIRQEDFVPFLRQFATLFRAGVNLVESLRIMSEQTSNKQLKKILVESTVKVARGNQLSEVFREYDDAFPPLFVNMLRAGEVTGNLEDVLDRMAEMMEKEHYVRQKVKSAMMYPAVIGVIAIAVSIFLLVSVIPNFVGSLLRVGGTIPTSTKIVMAISDHLIGNWFWYVLGFIGLFVGVRSLVRTKQGRYYFDLLKLKLPVFGMLMQKSAIARVSRTMSALFKSAVPTLQIFTIAAGVVGNEAYARALREARDSLTSGQSLVAPLRKNNLFPPLVTQMISIGEQTGNLDAMFAKIADFYEKDVDTTVDKLRPLIEPMMILMLSVIVGTLITAALAPIYELYKNTGH
jgi:type IV pilus assembly protein PilC